LGFLVALFFWRAEWPYWVNCVIWSSKESV
jgi:hypothetical protein